MKRVKALRSDQSGLVAITVTVFVILVLTLVVLAFSTIARREQRQALDRQLSTQAFYIAESAINDATAYIQGGGTVNQKTKCDQDPVFHPKLDAQGVFQQACVLFDTSPGSIEYDNLDDYKGALTSLLTTNNTPPETITIEWKDQTGPANFNKCTDTAPANLYKYLKKGSNPGEYSDGCSASMLKIALMPFSNGSNRDKLADDSYAVYLRPVKEGLPGVNPIYQPYSTGHNSQGLVIPAKCTASSQKCTATINGLPFGAKDLYMRITSIYNPSNVKVTGTLNGGGTAEFNSAQAMIDSTGRANDVLKRLQVRIPIKSTSYLTPPFVLESMDGICKRVNVWPGGASNSDCPGDLGL